MALTFPRECNTRSAQDATAQLTAPPAPAPARAVACTTPNAAERSGPACRHAGYAHMSSEPVPAAVGCPRDGRAAGRLGVVGMVCACERPQPGIGLASTRTRAVETDLAKPATPDVCPRPR